jgi:hypothetical protein
MTDVLPALIRLEGDPRLHQARLLVLLRAFAGQRANKTVAGLTKLAKLDFLLRYPTYLERALIARQKAADVRVRPEERRSVESAMIRYRYGPWDFRYRELLNELVGLGLVRVHVTGRTVEIGLTGLGAERADGLAADTRFEETMRRARLLKRHLDLSASGLRDFVYQTFPEIADMRMREEITP